MFRVAFYSRLLLIITQAYLIKHLLSLVSINLIEMNIADEAIFRSE